MLKGLTRKIIISNLFGMPLIFVALLLIDSGRTSLTDLQIQAMFQQANTLAGIITQRSAERYDRKRDKILRPKGGRGFYLRQPLIAQDTDALLFDTRGNIIEDSRRHLPGKITISPLEPIGNDETYKSRSRLLYEKIFRLFYQSNVTNYLLFEDDSGRFGADFIEFQDAIFGKSSAVIRINAQEQTILSVAVPIKRVGKILGVLKLSSSNTNIAAAVMHEREIICNLLIITVLISVVISFILARRIIRPLDKLKNTIQFAEKSHFRPDILKIVNLKKLIKRKDEIGYLSQSFDLLITKLTNHFQDIERFAADVAHELKNPLTSLKSALDTINYIQDPDKKQHLMKVAYHDIKRIDRLIGDISNLSRIDAEMKRENYKKIDLIDLLKGLAAHYHQGALCQNTKVIFHHDITSVAFLAIANRLGHAFSNIIENAFSFVPQDNGQIDIKLEQKNNNITIYFIDNGLGISDLERIFDRFYSDRTNEDNFGNHSGLGLSIVKRIIEAHNGTITAYNRTDRTTGAVFKITLPT